MPRLPIITVGLIAIVAACSPGASSAPTAAITQKPATAAPTEAAVITPAPTADACAIANLETVVAGTLTVGADNPAFPPYFEGRDGGNAEPWDPAWGDPTTGKGFESATIYALAKQLGFADTAVTWIPIAFSTSYAPGPKKFDVFIGQVTFNTDRAANADLTDGYYFGNQTVVTMANSKFAGATTLAALKDAELGAQVGTTSLATIEDVIKTTKDAAVYNTTDDAIEAMQSGLIDGIVVDLPTAGFITTVQVEGSKIVGQIGSAAGAQPEHFSLVLAQGNTLTACVNQAIVAVDAAGTLDALSAQYLPFNSAPELQP